MDNSSIVLRLAGLRRRLKRRGATHAAEIGNRFEAEGDFVPQFTDQPVHRP
jgi:hypothetical protein